MIDSQSDEPRRVELGTKTTAALEYGSDTNTLGDTGTLHATTE